MAIPSVIDKDSYFIFTNDDGVFYVWKNVTNNGAGKLVGPGYIGYIISSDSLKCVTNGFVSPNITVNDPRMQGFGISGWHHFRDNNESNIWNKGWDFRGNRLPGSDPFGVKDCDIPFQPYIDPNKNIRASFIVNFVDRYSAAVGKRCMSVRYDYIFEPSNIKMWVTYTVLPDGDDNGPTMYVKEPKFAFCTGPDIVKGYKPLFLSIFDTNKELRLIDLINNSKLQDPTTGTVQVGFNNRIRARFFDNSEYWNIVARSNSKIIYDSNQKVSSYGVRENWEGVGFGIDEWARLANNRTELDSKICAAYCKQGVSDIYGKSGLTRQWEIAKRGTNSNIEIMFHGWEGGSGLPDCLCCAKSIVIGETYSNFFSISKDAGWTI